MDYIKLQFKNKIEETFLAFSLNHYGLYVKEFYQEDMIIKCEKILTEFI